jgi:hypothetical protein
MTFAHAHLKGCRAALSGSSSSQEASDTKNELAMSRVTASYKAAAELSPSSASVSASAGL